MTKRLVLAFAAYVALAALVLTTINDPKIRAATLVVLAMFAVKTWIRRGDVMHRDVDDAETQDLETQAATSCLVQGNGSSEEC